MEVRTNHMESARRCLAAAVERMDVKDFKTAGALFRAAGRYMDEIWAGSDDEAGELLTFPIALTGR